jgi:hypothetical protein
MIPRNRLQQQLQQHPRSHPRVYIPPPQQTEHIPPQPIKDLQPAAFLGRHSNTVAAALLLPQQQQRAQGQRR